MSVSIALIPVALAMRVAMGKEGFEDWIRSQEQSFETGLISESDLIRLVRAAGYDAKPFAGMIKTHLDDRTTVVLWELQDAGWVLRTAKNIDHEMLERMMNAISRVAGSRAFVQAPQVVEAPQQFPTNFRDSELLSRTLAEFGTDPVKRGDGSIRCRIEGCELRFTQQGNAPFMVEVSNAPDLNQVYQYLAVLDDDYRRCVQSAVYQKLKMRAAQQNLVLESEEVLADKSIVVTLRVD